MRNERNANANSVDSARVFANLFCFSSQKLIWYMVKAYQIRNQR